MENLPNLLAKLGITYQLKPLQFEVIQNILNGQHSMAFLPTGYGKTLCYTLPPLLLDAKNPELGPHVALVISPLRSLMADQVERCTQMGIKSVAIFKQTEMETEAVDCLQTGSASIIYTSPEALEGGPWIKLMKKYAKRICVIAMDEIHCLSEWGSDFRPAFLKMVRLRSLFTSAPVLGLSATVTDSILTDILNVLQLDKQDVVIVSAPPDRPNIFLEVVHKKSYDLEQDLGWIVEGLLSKKQLYSKTLVFAQTIMQVADIYEFLKITLDCRAENGAYANGERIYSSRLVSMYHGQLSKEIQSFTLSTFKRPDSPLRVLVSTIAFGMGVEIVDVRDVVHWGKSKSLLTHWQEIGRAGRDGLPARAIWYPKSTAGNDKATFDSIKQNQKECVRKTFLNHFILPGMHTDFIAQLGTSTSCLNQCWSCSCALCKCCSHCRQKCFCSDEALPNAGGAM